MTSSGETATQSAERAGCIPTDDLAAMVAGDLSPQRIEAIVAHVDTCTRCAEVIANLAALTTAIGDGRYQIGRVIGSGAMGIVYEAWDAQLQRKVAIKVVRPERANPAARARMLREARALARISHPNVLPVYDVTEREGELLVATELVEGETIATWQVGRPFDEVLGAWLQAGRGLAAAHQGGVIHRDVKPANILVGRDGRVRVGDFGLARVGDSTAGILVERPSQPFDPISSVAGTPAYMAPEQASGKPEAPSDQYALCVGIAEAITGVRPDADGVVVVREHPRLGEVLSRGVRADPAARFPSVDALVTAITAAIAPRRRVVALAIGSTLLAVAAVAAWLAVGRAAACEPVAVADDVWAARAALAGRIPATVLPRLDAWLVGWSRAAADVCTTDRDAPILRDRRDRCLIDQLASLEHQLGKWQLGLDTGPMDAHEAVENLPRGWRCSHAAQLAVPDPTNDQLPALASIELARRRIEAGDPALVLPQLRLLFARAAATDYGPVVVELGRKVAGLERDTDREAATRTMRDTIAIADRAGAEVPRIEARIELATILGSVHRDESLRVVDEARALLAALGGAPELEANLEYAAADVMSAANRIGEAVAGYERALRNVRIAYGPDSIFEILIQLSLSQIYQDHKAAVAAHDAADAINRRAGFEIPIPSFGESDDGEAMIRETERMYQLAHQRFPHSDAEVDAEINLATMYFVTADNDHALEHFRHATALGTELGLHSSRMATSFSTMAALDLDLRRPRDAATAARTAIDLATSVGDDHALGLALTESGAAALALRETKEAITQFEQALTVLERANAAAEARSRTRFLLATATWPTDPKRALTYAYAARADQDSALTMLADAPRRLRDVQQQRLVDIERWIATHPLAEK